MSVVCLMFLAE